MTDTSTLSKDIIPVTIEDEMRGSYLDYAMSVIVGRALPDVRGWLKAGASTNFTFYERRWLRI